MSSMLVALMTTPQMPRPTMVYHTIALQKRDIHGRKAKVVGAKSWQHRCPDPQSHFCPAKPSFIRHGKKTARVGVKSWQCSAAGGVDDNTTDAQTHNHTIALQKHDLHGRKAEVVGVKK
jgi:hypothetical protein